MTTEQNEIKSAEWRKKNLSKNGVLADVIKSACVRHTYEVKHKDTIAVKVCKKCCHVK